VVLCALEFERAALVQAGIDLLAEVACCGPGGDGIVRWAEREGPRREHVILAGLAGSLRETLEPGDAFIAATVMSPKGGHFRSAAEVALEGDRHVRRVVIASSERVLTTREEKRALAEKTGADLVDLESAVFAEAAGIFGWTWAIVRGVSDGAGQNLPAGIEKWVGADGRTRTLPVLLSILRRPWIVPGMLRLRRQSRRAMEAAAEIVRELSSAGKPGDSIREKM